MTTEPVQNPVFSEAPHLTADEARVLLRMLDDSYRPRQMWEATPLPPVHIQRLLDKLERLTRQ